MKKLFKREWFWLGIIILIGAFLRFWNITSWQHLTYDQARDYLILKRLIVDHKYTLVGPTVSIAPGFFLPPFYYYSLTPFLLLSNFHIVGPDVYTAVLGVISILIFYFLAKDIFGIFPAILASFAYGINPYLVQTSRHAWNPNTISLFTIIFFLSFERYLFKKPASPSTSSLCLQGGQRKWLLMAGFSLGWAIGLHLTAIVFFPFYLYLLFLEFKSKYFDKITFFGIALFLVTFSPLLIFDLKHDFPITRAGISYVRGKSANSGEISVRLLEMSKDLYKMPVVLLSGLFQKENMTVRPSNITAFSRVNIFIVGQIKEKIRIVFSLFLWLMALLMLFVRKNKHFKMMIFFLLFGFLVRLCFPADLFYFYYYLSVFPLVFLVLASLIEKAGRNKILLVLSISVTLFLAVFTWFTDGFYIDPKPENYFLPVSKIIAKDAEGKKAVIAGNVSDKSRWEHNGLEYRYFAEAIYNLKPQNWEASDYKTADVLYFIDEGEVKDPLKFGGMEVEAFKPTKIEKVWQVETGQKIYKLLKI